MLESNAVVCDYKGAAVAAMRCLRYVSVLDCDSASLGIISEPRNDQNESILLFALHTLGDKKIIPKSNI